MIEIWNYFSKIAVLYHRSHSWRWYAMRATIILTRGINGRRSEDPGSINQNRFSPHVSQNSHFAGISRSGDIQQSTFSGSNFPLHLQVNPSNASSRSVASSHRSSSMNVWRDRLGFSNHRITVIGEGSTVESNYDTADNSTNVSISNQNDNRSSSTISPSIATLEGQHRQMILQTRHRFQFAVTSVALVFSLLLFAILICWVVFTSAYILSVDKVCDVPLKNYYWWSTLQLLLDVFRADIMRFCCCHNTATPGNDNGSEARSNNDNNSRNTSRQDAIINLHREIGPSAPQNVVISEITPNNSVRFTSQTPPSAPPMSSLSPEATRSIPLRISVYNMVYFTYAIWVINLGCTSVFYDARISDGPTCLATAPELFASGRAFCILTLMAWTAIVLGYLVPICYWTFVVGGGGARGFLDQLASSGSVVAPAPTVPQSFAHYVPYLPLVNLDDPGFVTGVYPKDCCICMNEFHLESNKSSVGQVEESKLSHSSTGTARGIQDVIIITPCRHLFHRQCCLEWMELARTCPVCRTDLVEALQLSFHDRRQNATVEEGWQSMNTAIQSHDSPSSPLGVVRQMWSVPQWLLMSHNPRRQGTRPFSVSQHEDDSVTDEEADEESGGDNSGVTNVD